jgi:hypothetical protein
MFFRIKKSGDREVVENKRVDGAVRQSVIANLGRADTFLASGALASLLASRAFSSSILDQGRGRCGPDLALAPERRFAFLVKRDHLGTARRGAATFH